jgi:hypothetical protein
LMCGQSFIQNLHTTMYLINRDIIRRIKSNKKPQKSNFHSYYF